MITMKRSDYSKAGGLQMLRGKIKWWSETRGYGFITCEDGGEVFCHYKEIIKLPGEVKVDLIEGQEVKFDIENNPKGPAAKRIVRL